MRVRDLLSADSIVPLHEREELLERLLNLDRADLYLRPDCELLSEEHRTYLAWLTRRENGEPLQHITGLCAFLSHDYEVGPDVLVPRPETEVLVRTVLDWLLSQDRSRLVGCEVGLGSGCIAIELLSAVPKLNVIATEVSEGAIERARSNALRILGESSSRLSIHRVRDASQVRLDHVGPVDFMVSNPPYLPGPDHSTGEVHAHEPRIALYAPPGDPLFYYREIAAWVQMLSPRPQAIFFEVDPSFGSQVSEILNRAGYRVQTRCDLVGRERVLFGLRSE